MHDTSTSPLASSMTTERRCWRCLQMFPSEAGLNAANLADFWLCDPCAATLLPSRRRPTTA